MKTNFNTETKTPTVSDVDLNFISDYKKQLCVLNLVFKLSFLFKINHQALSQHRI